MKKWYEIVSSANKAASINILDEIGSYGISANAFTAELAELRDIEEITVYINSPGGSVQDGIAIYNSLKEHPAHVIVRITGWALSMGSYIAMAGDEIKMSSNGLMMIHNPWVSAKGNASELRQTANILDKARDSMITAYSRSGKSRDEIISLLEAETWFSAEEAIEANFIDEIVVTDLPALASFTHNFEVPPRFKTNIKGNAMPNTTVMSREQILAADANRRTSIKDLYARFMDTPGVKGLLEQCLDDVNCSADLAGPKLLAFLGAGASPVNGGTTPAMFAQMAADQRPADFKEACMQSLLIRNGVRVPNASPLVRDVERMSVVTMAENILSMQGKRIESMGRAEIIKAALSTSDFPELLSNTAGKALRLGYENDPATHTIWTGEKEVADFKIQTLVALSEAPGLLEVPEYGEYKHGSFGEAAERFAVKPHGRVLQISRQALINDDLGALTQMPAAFGASARRKEADLVYEKLTGLTKLSDGKDLFHLDHGNLGPAASLSTNSLSAARAAMRRQKGIAGIGYIDPQPRYLIVPVTMESDAEVILNSAVLPSAQNDTNNLQWIRNLTVVADPRLDDVSTKAWYLAASPAQLDTIVRAYLVGEERPSYEENWEFMKDVMAVKCRLDVGVGVIDYRGLYKNPGQ